MQRSPFQIDGPALISLSGGRTSGEMLRRFLEHYDGTLPEHTHVTFANTGKEREETLEFVRDIAEQWKIRVRWLEWAGTTRWVTDKKTGEPKEQTKHSFREVDFFTASRNGEPFERRIKLKKYLPNPVTRWCTIELKIRTMKAFMVAQGYDHWTNYVGIRADEPRRIVKVKKFFEDTQIELDLGLPPVAKKKRRTEAERQRYDTEFPLARAGVTKPDVHAEWAKQPFDLRLDEWEGNCDLCFLKAEWKRARVIHDHPETAEWWQRMEHETDATFRAKGRNYDQLEQLAMMPNLIPEEEDDLGDLADCFCGVG